MVLIVVGITLNDLTYFVVKPSNNNRIFTGADNKFAQYCFRKKNV